MLATAPVAFRPTNGWFKNPDRNRIPAVNGSQVIQQVLPGARVTSGYRGPDHPLSKKNPNSWHAKSQGAVDIAPIPGMTFEQAGQRLMAAGYEILEAGDEVNHPSGHATGPHWHFVLGKR